MGGLGKKDQKHPTYIFSRIIEFPTSRYPPRNQQFASENGWLEDSFWDGFLAGAFLLVSGRFSATDCVLGTMIMGDYSMILGMGMFQHVCLQKKHGWQPSTFDLWIHGLNLCGCEKFTSFFFAKTGYQRLIAMEILDAPSNFHIKSQDLPQTTINSFEDLFFKIWFDLNMALPALIGPIIIFVVSNIQPQPTSPNPNTASWSPILWTFFFDHHL